MLDRLLPTSIGIVVWILVSALAHSVVAAARPLEPVVSAAAWRGISDQLEQAYYEFERRRQGRQVVYAGVNRAQMLNAEFTARGLQLTSRSDAWRLSMLLTRAGYVNALRPMAAVDPVALGNRLQYDRAGLIEWYINDNNGLEQGFTFTESPPGAGGAWLALELAVAGDLRPRVPTADAELVFAHPGGMGALRYGQFQAWDATGRQLPVRMSVQPPVGGAKQDYRITLAVDAGDALYPVTVDPLITAQSSKITPFDAVAGDEFGTAVSVSGDLAAIGAPGDNDMGGDSGSVYIFGRNVTGADIWGQIMKLTATDAAAGDLFGQTVALSGDTLVVGAPAADAGGEDAGAAYLFVRNQGGADRWQQVVKLQAPDAGAGARFGAAVALSDDILVVGAPFAPGGGSAYVFERNQGGADRWGQVAVLRAADAAVTARFGAAAAVTVDTVVVGAPGSGEDVGGAYVFSRNQGGAEQWGQVAVLRTSATPSGGRFGAAVAIAAGIVITGAPLADAAYVFERNRGGPDNWGEVARLRALDAVPDDGFGVSVAIGGGAVVVGAHQKDDFGPSSGAVYIFERNQGGADRWGQVTKFAGDDTSAGDQFGDAIAMDSHTLFVGVHSDSDVGVNSGGAYAFLRSGDAWLQQAKSTVADATANDLFGTAVAVSGDILAVGAYQNDVAGIDAGAVYIFARNRGGADRWARVARLVAGGGASDQFGQALDLHGDTLVVGAAYSDSRGIDAGAAYVFERNRGGADHWGQVARLTAADAAAGDFFGSAVVVNGATVVIGAFADDDDGSASGAAYVFERNQGGVDGWGQVAKLTAADAQATDQFGIAVALDADTAVVGAHFEANAGTFSGAAYIFERNQGGPDSWGQVAKLVANDTMTDDQFGYAVAISNETIIIGAPGDDDAGPSTGSAYVFMRNKSGADRWGQIAKITAADANAGTRFGETVSLSGTIVAVGARRDEDAGEESGAVYVFGHNEGGTDRWGQLVKLLPRDIAQGDQFGSAVSLSGANLAVGAPFDDDRGNASGSVYIYRLAF